MTPILVERGQKLVERDANDAELFYYLGMSYYRLKQSAQAGQILQRALKLPLPAQMDEEARRALADCSETAPL